MKLSTIIMLACCLQLSATGFSQTITYTSQNASLLNVFKAIKQQTGYVVFYDQNIVGNVQGVSLDAKNEPLESFIRKALKGTSLNFDIQDKTIVISRKGSMTQLMDQVQSAAAMPQPIFGKVVDENGFAVTHATVTLQPLGKVVMTDGEGRFSFQGVPAGKYILSVTHVAYGKTEKRIKMENDVLEVTVNMQTEKRDLSGVDVSPSTGYQKLDRTKATGAYTVVTAQEISENPSVNLSEILASRGVPGVHFDLANNKIQIRGDNNFGAGSSSPLIVIDGFPAIEQNLANYPGSQQGGAILNPKANVPMNSSTILSIFNPNDIESITFLKDAAAASIWGDKAANGVIVIETKKGQRGRTVISLNSTVTVAGKPDMKNLDMMNSRQYIDLEKELWDNDYYTTDPLSNYRYQNVSEAITDLFAQKAGKISQTELDQRLEALAKRSNLSQIQRYLLQQAITQQYNLSLSGGSDASSFYISGNYTGNKPVFRENTSTSYSLLGNLTNNFFDRRLTFTTGLNMIYSDRQVNGAASEALGTGTTGLRPYDMLVDDNGNPINRAIDFTPHAIDSLTKVGYMPWYYNSANQLQSSNVFTTTSSRVTEQIRAKVTNWLNVSVSGMYQRNLTDMNNLQKLNSYTTLGIVNTATSFKNGKPTYGVPYGDILYTGHTVNNDYSLRGQFDIDKGWQGNKHHMSMIGGAEIRQSTSSGYSQAHYGFDEDQYTSVPVNPNIPYTTIYGYPSSLGSQSTSITVSRLRYLSYFSNASYTFLGKYFASGSLRFDDHNLVGVERRKRAIPLWSAGLRWNAKDEKFLRNVSWLDNLDARVSLGTGGNIPGTATPFAIISVTAPNPPTQPAQGAQIYNPANRDLTWATTRTLNFGIDASFLHSRLTFNADLFRKKTYDLIYQQKLNPTYGFTGRDMNSANLDGHGVELGVTGLPLRTADWTWTVNFNISFNTTKVTDNRFPNTLTTPGSIIATGYPVDNLFLYRFAGLDNRGQPQIYDGKHKVIASTEDVDFTPADLKYAGRTSPAYFGGFSNTVRYKMWTLQASMMYNMGYKVQRSDITTQMYPGMGGGSGFLVTSKQLAKRWRKPGDEAFTNVPGILNADFNTVQRYASSDVNTIDGSHIRLQLISLSYNLPAKALDYVRFIKNASIRASADNLGIVWRKNKEHIDPDYMFSGTYTGWPPVKNYALNLNLTF